MMKPRSRIARSPAALVLVAAIAALGSCAGFEGLMQRPARPEARITAAEITDLSFDAVELTATVRVDNPNPFGVSVAGIRYALDIAAARPLSGVSDRNIEIPAEDSSSLELPLRVAYVELYEMVSALAGQNEIGYGLELIPVVEVPVVGRVELPLQTDGTIPLLRLPQVAFGGIELRSLGPINAELAVLLEIDNPNSVALLVQSLPYTLEVDGRPILSGNLDDAGALQAGGNTRRTLMASVGLLDVGRTMWAAIVDGGRLPYRLEGSFTFGVDLPFVESTTVPFLFAGEQLLQPGLGPNSQRRTLWLAVEPLELVRQMTTKRGDCGA